MRLSGHSYKNDVFDSLLDGICKDVEVKKAAQRSEQAPISGMDIFSSTTQDTLNQIHEEQLESIAGELSFAADRAKVAVGTNDLAAFAQIAVRENLRGKALERAAQKFCNDLVREVSAPQRQSVLGGTPIEQQSGHQIVSATYDPSRVNDGNQVSGGFMGCSKNPNSIWDTDAMTRLAQKKFGDEQIKESKEAMEKLAYQQKEDHWKALQAQGEAPGQVRSGITNAGTSVDTATAHPNLGNAVMSIFDNKRDFEDVPSETEGEKIAKIAEARAQKAAEAKKEWNQVKPATKLNNNAVFDKLFSKEG